MMKTNLWRIAVISSLLLVGCRAHQASLEHLREPIQSPPPDVDGEAWKVKPLNLPKSHIEESLVVYHAYSSRDPFSLPPIALLAESPLSLKACWQPKAITIQHELQRYPLEQLHLKGMISRDAQYTALLQTPNGKVIAVAEGQPVGVNYGRVMRVSATQIEINESLPDGLGCWKRREVKLVLQQSRLDIEKSK
ncbi:pilus assembly protein PilP [Vibrio scophthalmi]|uniref:Type IV pilus biogenesis protein PilP n=1 Tax=Vibrio scophthalmi LMG 19158 TaxID=870967 RepID=F9RRB7_9VIBR|nr:pilus assembly protein PilP [Vibrio scophthalmi]EGU33466.1 type IV pilus biogenesis protein PilP [Vibrio scophthalmi LMG 19158]